MQDAGRPHAISISTFLCMRRNALHLAARSCNVDRLRRRVGGEDAAADAAYVNEPDRNGITALFLAMQKGAAPRLRAQRCSAEETLHGLLTEISFPVLNMVRAAAHSCLGGSSEPSAAQGPSLRTKPAALWCAALARSEVQVQKMMFVSDSVSGWSNRPFCRRRY